MESILISACLLGLATRYDAKSVSYDGIERLSEKFKLIPFCPEIYGGLPTPRTPAERCGNGVITRLGKTVTENYEKGAIAALSTARLLGCRVAVLKERSPACGTHEIYDGSFSGKKISGMGVAAELLKNNGIRVISEAEIDDFLKENE